MRALSKFGIALLISLLSTSAYAYCPPGSVPTGSGNPIMCLCPDGSYADYTGCRSTPSYRNSGQCARGEVRSRIGCIPRDADICSNGGYCNPGYKCAVVRGKCITHQAATVKRVLDHIGKKASEKIPDRVKERHRLGVEYLKENKEFQRAVQAFMQSRGIDHACANTLSGCALIANNIADAISINNEFQRGEYYSGTLHIVNRGSSNLLTVLKPKGGAALAESINIAGAAATAYAYGFFWGQ